MTNYSHQISPEPSPGLALEERISQLLGHLGISKAHFVARGAQDWTGLAETFPEFISSLTLVCPQGFDSSVLGSLASRLLVVSAERSEDTAEMGRHPEKFEKTQTINLSGFPVPNTYADISSQRQEEIAAGLVSFLQKMGQLHQTPSVDLAEETGEIAGISYRIRGSGPPVILFPLSAAPSQWEPIMATLTASYCAITLGGDQLGMVSSLEDRGRTPGYLGGVASLLEAAGLQPGEAVIEVGCGTGVLCRWIANRQPGSNPAQGHNKIVGVDVNPFFLREAAALVNREGMNNLVEFIEGSAEALPFPDERFDLAFSSTVIQRVNAEKMLSEMVRVTKLGGRVAVLGHAHDMPRWINLPLGETLKAKIDSPPWVTDRGHPEGCDDASLYRLFSNLGLSDLKMFPYMASFGGDSRLQGLQSSILPGLSPDETEEWHAAVIQAEAERTFFIGTPYHCCVGTKN